MEGRAGSNAFGKNAQFECPECEQIEQATYLGGTWNQLVQCAREPVRVLPVRKSTLEKNRTHVSVLVLLCRTMVFWSFSPSLTNGRSLYRLGYGTESCAIYRSDWKKISAVHSHKEGDCKMRTNEEIIRQAGRSRSMMDFYMIQMEILLYIRTLVRELIEISSTNRRADETKRRAGT